MRKAVIVLIVTVLVSGCQNGSPTPNEAQFKEWVQDRYVSPFRNGNVDVWLQIFAKDAVGMHHTLPPLQGIDEIRGFGEFIRDNFELDVYEVSVDEVRINGDWALTRGSYETRFLPVQFDGELPPPTVGKFLLLWERNTDGWQVILDMGNQNTPCGYEECE